MLAGHVLLSETRRLSTGVSAVAASHSRIGIDLGGTKVEGVLMDATGAIVARQRIATPRDDYPGTVAAIVGLTRQLAEGLDATPTVGVGIPGTIVASTGLVKNANSTWLNGQPLERDLSDALGRPVRCANDANCFAISEAVDGAAAGARVVFGVIVGTGCGGGVVFDGRGHSGPNGIAGEWGHNPLPWASADELPGPACYCGKHGCLETWISGTGLMRDFLHHSGRALDGPAIVAASEAGDAEAVAAMTRLENRMARALATVINLLDPDVIVLGGGLSKVKRLYGSLPVLIPAWTFSPANDLRIVPPVHGDSSGVRGAAWLWA